MLRQIQHIVADFIFFCCSFFVDGIFQIIYIFEKHHAVLPLQVKSLNRLNGGARNKMSLALNWKYCNHFRLSTCNSSCCLHFRIEFGIFVQSAKWNIDLFSQKMEFQRKYFLSTFFQFSENTYENEILNRNAVRINLTFRHPIWWLNFKVTFRSSHNRYMKKKLCDCETMFKKTVFEFFF